jgi:hypothetical protein
VEFCCGQGSFPVPASLIEEAASLRVITLVTARPDAMLRSVVESLRARRVTVTCFVTDTPDGRAFEAACDGGDTRVIATDDIGAYLQARGGSVI